MKNKTTQVTHTQLTLKTTQKCWNMCNTLVTATRTTVALPATTIMCHSSRSTGTTTNILKLKVSTINNNHLINHHSQLNQICLVLIIIKKNYKYLLILKESLINQKKVYKNLKW